jgi:hypothetical protein
MYEFFSDYLPEDERVPYKVIRWWLLDCYYGYCKTKIMGNKRWHHPWQKDEHELWYAYEQCEFAYSRPIENLMLEVLTLVLDAGRGSKLFEIERRAKISQILKENNLSEMLCELPNDERRQFEGDLALLDIVPF